MDFLTDLTNIRTIQWLACTDSFMLAFILMLIKVPQTEYSKKLANTKNTIAISFLVCGLMMAFSLYKYPLVWNYERFSSLTMLVAAAFSSMAMSYSMINLLDDKTISGNRFTMNIFLLTAASIALLESFLSENSVYPAIFGICIALFVIQSIYYIVLFDKAYKKSGKMLEAYYDDEEEHKIRWIRFCYIIAMLTDMFLLVYMVLPNGFMKIYIAWYVLFMLYFTGNFISFIGSHKLILDAFAHRTLSGQDLFPAKRKARKDNPEKDRKKIEKEFEALDRHIAQWVESKKYREYDKSREEIAEELRTSNEILQLYFSQRIGQDFRSWRTELRINDAKKILLDNREISINLAGEMCGFSDRSNFHRQFVKLVGCSPKKWRDTDGHPEAE
ncbi:MAG: helix-turn-helix domain-containing protein [Clostridium sp.]|nr:helix-turn-helix domain-containing protein [Bacteroides sp.]MCM1197364.1 helix-turn-helix domain-containing protein [Clostridium sp.]